jgi:hypothetical protein
VGVVKIYIKIIIIIKLENEIVISEIVFGMVHGRPYNEFQKVPIYQFRLLVTEINPSCGWLPMSLYHKIQRKKEKNLGINLKYNKNLFSLKIHFPKKIVDFCFFRNRKITNKYLLFENLRPKDCEISPRKNKKNQLPPTVLKSLRFSKIGD